MRMSAGHMFCVVPLQLLLSFGELQRATALLPSQQEGWPEDAPSKDSLIQPTDRKWIELRKKPAYLDYDAEWSPDGIVPMRQNKVMNGTAGDWYAICYTQEKATKLGVTMFGFKVGTPNALKYESEHLGGHSPVCTKKVTSSESALVSIASTRTAVRRSIGPMPAKRLLSGRSTDLSGDVMNAWDTDHDRTLNFYEALMLAHKMALEEVPGSTQQNEMKAAFPPQFQFDVRSSVKSVDMDNDRRDTLTLNELSQWLRQDWHFQLSSA